MEHTEDVVRSAQAGDESAFNQIYEEYHRLVYYIALKMTHNHADAQEVLQEVFIQVHASIHQLREPRMLKGWISQITANKCKHIFRKNNMTLLDDGLIDVLQYQEEEEYTDFLPEQLMRYQNDVDVIKACISHLKPKYQEIITCYYFEQKSIQEISHDLRIPLGSVKTRLLYARQYLKKEVERYIKENEIAITFRVGAWESVLLMMGGCAGTKALANTSFFSRHLKGMQHVIISKACVLCMAGGVFLYGGAAWFQQMQSEQKINEYAHKDVSDFPALVYQNRTIETPKEAYRELLAFAHCEKEMKERTQEEFLEIQPIYHALKQYEQGYYHLLQRDQWTTAFEKYVK